MASVYPLIDGRHVLAQAVKSAWKSLKGEEPVKEVEVSVTSTPAYGFQASDLVEGKGEGPIVDILRGQKEASN